MLRKIFVFLGFLSLSTAGLFAQGNSKTGEITEKVQTVEYAMSRAGTLDVVVVEGVFSSQVDKKEYILEDKSGKIIVELSKSTLRNGYPIMKDTMGMSGFRVRVRGIVKKKWSGNHELQANAIQILKA